MSLKKSLILAAILPAFCITHAMAEADYPITLIDDRGAAVTVDQSPENIASLGLFASDVLKALGHKAVGATTYNGVQPLYLGADIEGMANFGDVSQPNIELMTEVNTDFVIGLRRYSEPYADDFAKMGPFLAFDLDTYQDSIHAITTVSTALGEAEKGREINAAFDKLVRTYNAETANAAESGPSAAFIWWWQDTMYIYYDHVLPGSFFGTLNATNAFGSNPTPMLKENFGRPITNEELLALNPDVLVVYKPGKNEYPNNPALQRLDAVKNNRAWHVGYQYSQPSGPIARELVLKELAYLLYPTQFEKPDLPAGVAAEPMSFAQ